MTRNSKYTVLLVKYAKLVTTQLGLLCSFNEMKDPELYFFSSFRILNRLNVADGMWIIKCILAMIGHLGLCFRKS